ncbi:MAG: D-alanyl-D-alanine carboxypeptidase [Chloroflexi bacterium]|nr:D-alanyl-D-alanine carboxypeptidase [Chloroflexota bacterium]
MKASQKSLKIAKQSLLLMLILMAIWLTACNPKPAADLLPQAPAATETPFNTPTPAATQTLSPTATADAAATAAYQNLLYEQSGLNLSAVSAVLLDAQSGEVLLGKNSSQEMFPASTTKIMTALLALEHFDLDERIVVGEEIDQAYTPLRVNANKAGLALGQNISMKDLLYGLLLISGSDAAFVIAVNTARRESGTAFASVDEAVAYFSAMMNKRAKEIGALNSHFVNPDGFHDPDHYSSAYDLAIIAQTAMQNSTFRDIVQTPVYQTREIVSENGSITLRWQNTNRLLDLHDVYYYAPANGIKTGTTNEAGSCLISSAYFNDRLMIAVVLDSTTENVWSDSISLLEYARMKLSDGS